MTDELRALPDDIRALLAAERTSPVPTDGADALLARIEASAAAPAAPPAAGAPVLKLLTIAVAAVGIGAAAYYYARTSSTSPAIAAEPVPAPVPVPVPVPVPDPPAPVVTALTPTPTLPQEEGRRAPAERRTPPQPADTLAAERAILDRAQRALVDSDPTSAITALQRHRRRFHRGVLAEERDAMWVRALVIRGDANAARARATRFHRAYPQSIQWPAVEASLEDLE